MSGLAARETTGTSAGAEILRRTVAVVDMVGYSSIARMLEENISAVSVSDLNKQIQTFMVRSLEQLPEQHAYSVFATTGDGIIVLFERADDAHRFAHQVHLLARDHNDRRTERTAQRWFRVGIATGELSPNTDPTLGAEYAGTTIANAVRLESAAAAGEIMVDADSFAELSDELKSLYGKGETIKGKREERYLVRRCVVTPRGKDAGKFLRPLMTRRALIGSGAAALSGAALTAWLGRSAIERWMHPLPAKRFVALMAWPAATPEDAPLIAGVLNTIYRRLSRAEASVRDLLVVSPEDRSDQEATGAQRSASDRSPREVADTWGANLVFAVRVVQAASRPVLELQVLDSTATKQLRKDRLPIDASTGGDLGDKASAAAARLLDLPVDQMQLSDDAELAGVSQADRALFDKAKLLRNDPNGLKNSEAIAAFQQLVSVSPRFALAYAELGSLYLQQFFRSHDVAALVLSGKNFGVALSLNPDSESAQLGQAEFQLASGQPDVALAGLTRILRSDPDSSDALLLKAKAYKQLNRPEQQEQIYRELTRVRPNYWPAYNDLGEFLHGEAKNAEAAQCFQTASLLAPKATVPLINLGTVLYEQGRSAEAKAALQRSIAIAPNETALTLLGDISFGEKDYRSALSYYLRAQRLAPKDDFVLTDLGDCYEMLGSHTEMLAAYTQAAGILSSDLAINPNNGQAWMTLAFYHAKIGDKAAAESDIANAERHGAKDVQALFTKARAEALLGRTEEAKALVLRCLDQGWSPANVDLATELSAVRATPEYKERIEKLNAKAS